MVIKQLEHQLKLFTDEDQVNQSFLSVLSVKDFKGDIIQYQNHQIFRRFVFVKSMRLVVQG